MGFVDDIDAAALAWRVEAIAAGSEKMNAGPVVGQPMDLNRRLNRIEAKLNALLGGTVTVQVQSLTNGHRRNNSCNPAVSDGRLARAAFDHSLWMSDNNTMSHTGAGGSSAWDRAVAAGYTPSALGEVLGSGYATAQAAVDGWMASPPHRDIILNCSYVHLGVGVVGTWYTMVLATPA